MALLLATLAAGCATVPKAPKVASVPMPPARLAMLVQPGDKLEIRFPYWPELDDTQVVDPEGRVTLRLVNAVPVAWHSPEEVRATLLERYRAFLNEPEISVLLHTEERFVYVGGEVNIPPGLVHIRVPIQGRLTAMQAILQAGGFTKTSADLSRILIVRQFEDRQCARTLDLRDEFRLAESQPFMLEPNDIVFVPRTAIDRADQWVDQYMNRLVPDWVNFNLGLTRTQSETVGARTTVTGTFNGTTVSHSK